MKSMGSPGYLSIFDTKGLSVSSWHQIFLKMKENVYKNITRPPQVNIEVEDRSLGQHFCRAFSFCIYIFDFTYCQRKNQSEKNILGVQTLCLGTILTTGEF